MPFDEARINVVSGDLSRNLSLWLYSLFTDCLSCPYSRMREIASNANTGFQFPTKAIKWRILNNNGSDEYISAKNTSNIFCELSPSLGQYGVYELAIENNGCNFRTLNNPTFPYTELIIALGIIVLILFGISAGRWHICKKQHDGEEETTNKGPSKRRVKAIDAFRGASMLFMIFVNDDCGSYCFVLGHSIWDGLLPGDLVFPCFMWIMGVCVPIALSAQLKREVSKSKIVYSILKRSIFLFLIGVSLNTLNTESPQLEDIRVFGVLQRFGIAYLVVSMMYLCFTPLLQNSSQSRIKRVLQDVAVLLPQWCCMLLLVIIHCFVTFVLTIPGCPPGYLGPGGRHEDGRYFKCTGGAAGYIDHAVLTARHMYNKSAIQSVYEAIPFDPEGILGCFTTMFQVFLGVHAGVILMIYKGWKERVIRWLLWAVLYGVLGCALHFYNVIPVNKNLWSLSFVFVTTSFALAFLSVCYVLIDVIQVWRGGPFRILGMNALVLYVGHMMCYQIFPFHWRAYMMETRSLVLFESIWGVALWIIIAYIMHHKRIYVTL